MPKKTTIYACNECGAMYSKWVGRCTSCESWNTIVEEVDERVFTGSAGKAGVGGGKGFGGKSNSKRARSEDIEYDVLSGVIEDVPRIMLKNPELNRVFGGGIVPGSVVLIAGEPGVGKSTLMLELAKEFVGLGAEVVYASGEESPAQIKARATRIGIGGGYSKSLRHDAPKGEAENKCENGATNKAGTLLNCRDESNDTPRDQGGVKLLNKMDVDTLSLVLDSLPERSVLILDSIQTVYSADIPSAPGSVVQVRACAHELSVLAKRRNISLFIVGHINKDGQVAGPKVLEHIVDVVLYFELGFIGEYRMIRNVKNRFGSVQEVGIFAMEESGLCAIENPSEMFLTSKKQDNIGSVAFAGIEGTRPIFTQVESLVMPSYIPSPRRSVVGWDSNRLAMIVAVMSSRLFCKLYDKEIYLSVSGGLRISETAIDLAVLVSLYSALHGVMLPHNIVCFGEVSLSGEVKAIRFAESRAKEAARLGFEGIIYPRPNSNLAKASNQGNAKLYPVGDVLDVAALPFFKGVGNVDKKRH